MSTRSHRNGNQQFERTIDHAQRDAEAARLKAQGLTYQQIADQLEYADRSNAHRAVQRALAAVPAAAVDELRRIETMRLETCIAKAFEVLNTEHPLVSHGRRIDGLTDPAPKLAAIREIRQCSESLRKLHGADAPIRHEVFTLDAIEAEITQLETELAERAAADETAAAQGAPAATS